METTIKKVSPVENLRDAHAEKSKEKSLLLNRKPERGFSPRELAKKPVSPKPSEDKLV